MTAVLSTKTSGSIGHDVSLRSVAIECGHALDYELTYKELIRFLPNNILEEFIQHLETVADIEDITEELKEYK